MFGYTLVLQKEYDKLIYAIQERDETIRYLTQEKQDYQQKKERLKCCEVEMQTLHFEIQRLQMEIARLVGEGYRF